MTTDKEIDARGLKCPLPVLKARKEMRGMVGGSVLTILADDPAAIIDFPHFCAEQGHEFLGESDAADGGTAYRLRKGS